jgi:hypothetical protein
MKTGVDQNLIGGNVSLKRSTVMMNSFWLSKFLPLRFFFQIYTFLSIFGVILNPASLFETGIQTGATNTGAINNLHSWNLSCAQSVLCLILNLMAFTKYIVIRDTCQ